MLRKIYDDASDPNSGFANYDEDSEIIDFVTSKTNIELLELDFDEE